MRVHPHLFGSSEFDRRSTQFRFSPLQFGGQRPAVAYCGEDDAAVLSETLFHTVDTTGGSGRPRQVYLTKYIAWQWSPIAFERALTLIRIDDPGLASIGVTRAQLVESDQRSYPSITQWGQRLLAVEPDADGLLWYSRQAPGRLAVLLLESGKGRSGGVYRADVHGTGPSVPFLSAQGLERLDQVADDLDITVIRS